MPSALQLPLSLLVGGAICFYGASQLIWHGFGRHRSAFGFARGMTLAVPVILIALILAFRGQSSAGLSLLTTGSVLMLTLALGASAMSGHGAIIASPALRVLPGVCAATCLVGFSGELRLEHAAAVGLVAIAMIWSVRTRASKSSDPCSASGIGLGLVLACGGAVVLATAVEKLAGLSIAPLVAPAILPLVILGSVGLLVGDVHHHAGSAVAETVSGFVVLLLGIGVPIQIVAAYTMRAIVIGPQIDEPVIVMPVLSWRIDSVLLLAISLLLLPAGFGRMRIGRLEGLFLVLVCIAYMMVTVTAGKR